MEAELVHACQVASVEFNFLQPHGIQPFKLLYSWDSPGRNTGVGCHALLQGIFLTQELNHFCYLSCIGRWDLYHKCHLDSPGTYIFKWQFNVEITLQSFWKDFKNFKCVVLELNVWTTRETNLLYAKFTKVRMCKHWHINSVSVFLIILSLENLEN